MNKYRIEQLRGSRKARPYASESVSFQMKQMPEPAERIKESKPGTV